MTWVRSNKNYRRKWHDDENRREEEELRDMADAKIEPMCIQTDTGAKRQLWNCLGNELMCSRSLHIYWIAFSLNTAHSHSFLTTFFPDLQYLQLEAHGIEIMTIGYNFWSSSLYVRAHDIHTVLIDWFHSIFHHRNLRAIVSCNVDINQSAGSMVM